MMKLTAGMKAPSFSAQTIDDQALSFPSPDRAALLVFLRGFA